MDLSDSRVIAAPRADVWAALLSANVLKDCVPGCQDMTGNPEEGSEAVEGSAGEPPKIEDAVSAGGDAAAKKIWLKRAFSS